MQNHKRAKIYLENLPLFKDKKALDEVTKVNESNKSKIIVASVLGLTAAAITLVMNLIMWFSMFNTFRKTGKPEPKLEKELQAILKSSQKWNIYSVDDREPNGMTIGKNFIIITRGLYKILNDDELMAVLLHEAGHNTGKHIQKQLAAIGTFAVIAGQAGAMVGVATAILVPPLAMVGVYFAFLIFFLMLGAGMTRYNVTIGRKHEYYSDSYAAKYGYGEHLITALQKFDKWVNTEMKRRPCGQECKKQIEISESLDEHPSLKDRVENILKTKSDMIMKALSSPSQLKQFFMTELGIKK